MGQALGPYERALGDRVAELHPVLQRYFAAIPPGSVGLGVGVFDDFGTDRRWLRPVLAILRPFHILIPGQHRDVPFRVENRTVDGRQTAVRTLTLGARSWSMIDSVHLTAEGTADLPGRVTDVLGRPALLAADFDVTTEDGGLRLNSRRVALQVGPVRVPLPRPIRPVIVLTERFDDEAQRQRVRLTVDLPGLGRIYHYGGQFTYRIDDSAR